MARPKKYDTTADRVQAWQAQKTDRIVLNIRKDADITKDMLARAAKALGMSLSDLLVTGAEMLILERLGQSWIDESMEGET